MNQRLTKPETGAPPDEMAAYWVMRRNSGSMDAAERIDFNQWIAQSPENGREFVALMSALETVDAAGDQLLAAEFQDELQAESRRAEQGRRSDLRRLAATLAIVSIGAVTAAVLQFAARPQTVAYETRIGESRIVTFEDGSEAELNTASKLRVSYEKSRRVVSLESGEAFFNVEKDKSRPFIVRTAQAEITVTGTSFNVSDIDGNVTVQVLTGIVDVDAPSGPTSMLLAGDTISINENGEASEIMQFDPGMALAWRSGKVRFRNEPLDNVVNSLNRYFETPIEIGDPSIGDLPVTGEFDIRDRDAAITALTLIFGLESVEEPARAVLKPAGAK